MKCAVRRKLRRFRRKFARTCKGENVDVKKSILYLNKKQKYQYMVDCVTADSDISPVWSWIEINSTFDISSVIYYSPFIPMPHTGVVF